MQLHPWCQQRDLVAYCNAQGIAVQAYSPLTRGTRLADPVLASISERLRRGLQDRPASGSSAAGPTPDTPPSTAAPTPAQVLVRYALQKGWCLVAKTGDPARARENADVFGFELGARDVARLDALDPGDASGALFARNVARG